MTRAATRPKVVAAENFVITLPAVEPTDPEPVTTRDQAARAFDAYRRANEALVAIHNDVERGARPDNDESDQAFTRASREVTRLERIHRSLQYQAGIEHAAESSAADGGHSATTAAERQAALAAARAATGGGLAAATDERTGHDLTADVRALGEDNKRTPLAWDLDARPHIARINSMRRNLHRLDDHLDEIAMRALTTAATGSNAGALIDDELVPMIYGNVVHNATILQTRATIIPTMRAHRLKYPRATSDSVATKVGEGGQISESLPNFGTMELEAYKYGFLIPLTFELERDEEAGLTAYLSDQAGRAHGNKLGQEALIGDGSDDPNGIISAVGAAGRKTLADVDAFTADSLIELQHEVPVPYRRRAEFMLSDQAMLAARKFKDDDGRYLLQPSIAMGVPATILGQPYHIDPYLDGVAAGGSNIAVYGDFATCYIRMVGMMRIDRDTSVRFETDEVVWRFLWEWDVDLINNAGLKVLHIT